MVGFFPPADLIVDTARVSITSTPRKFKSEFTPENEWLEAYSFFGMVKFQGRAVKLQGCVHVYIYIFTYIHIITFYIYILTHIYTHLYIYIYRPNCCMSRVS